MDVHPIELLQDQAQCILASFIKHKYPKQDTRFGKLLLLLPCVRAIKTNAVETLFFKETIGEMSIQKLLSDIYYLDKLD